MKDSSYFDMTDKKFDSQITFVYVKNLDISRKFYEDLLGLRLVHDQGTCRIVKIAGEAYLGYCSMNQQMIGGEGVLITLVVNEVDEWYQLLIDNKVNLFDPPRHNPEYGIYHFFFLDPDGYRWEIQRFDDENWMNKDS
jgi:catechol 2,3-dioxygenase-like lactoylglutathione lyase family enzyme